MCRAFIIKVMHLNLRHKLNGIIANPKINRILLKRSLKNILFTETINDYY